MTKSDQQRLRRLGANVAEAARNANLNPEALARASGLSLTTAKNLINGETWPALRTLSKVVAALRKSGSDVKTIADLLPEGF